MGIMLLLALVTVQDRIFLPKWMTPEESLRVNEIGKGHVVTAPPGQWVETPGEYEPVRGVFVAWDYGTFNTVEREIVRNVVPSCKANIIAYSSDTNSIRSYLSSGGVPLDSVRFYIFPFNSCWMRDYGPWFMRKQDNTEGIVDFQYNRPRPSDDTIPWRIGQAWGISVYGSPLEHPGGNFMVDGHGTGFFSSLIYEENPGYSAAQIRQLMLDYSGLEHCLPVKRMLTEYTGHIDLWTKILNDTLVMVGDYESGHPNDTVLDNRADSIDGTLNAEGFPFRVVRVIMPWDLSDAPPTYLNSLFVNDRVLVPTWGLAQDPEGLAAYSTYLPGYNVVGINCSSMASSGGAIHCITMQVPKSQYIHFQHTPLTDTNDTLNPYRVRSRIITSSALLAESTLVYYKINSTATYSTTPLSPVVDTAGVYAGYIPAQSWDDTVHYYMLARNTHGIRKTCPFYAPGQHYMFIVSGDVAIAEAGVSGINDLFIYPSLARAYINFAVALSSRTRLRIEVYNVLGQHAKLITDGVYEKGRHTLQWKLDDDHGTRLPAGAYFYRIITENETVTGKLLLTK